MAIEGAFLTRFGKRCSVSSMLAAGRLVVRGARRIVRFTKMVEEVLYLHMMCYRLDAGESSCGRVWSRK